MVYRSPDESTPPATKTVKGVALLVTSQGADKAQTCLGYLVAPSPDKLQQLVDFLRTCPPMQIRAAMLTGASVTVNTPGA